MTTAAGQCLRCGYRNSEGALQCARCEAVVALRTPDETRQFQSAMPWIIAGSVFIFMAMMFLRQNAAPPSVASSHAFSSIEPAGAPPPDEPLMVTEVGSTTAPAAPSPATGASGQWHALMNINGSGPRKTTPFPITSRFWRIRWTATPNQDANAWLYAIIYRQNGANAGMAMSNKGAGSGVTRLQGRGTYLIEVKSTQSWTMDVEQWY